MLLGQLLQFGIAVQKLLAEFTRRGGHQFASKSVASLPLAAKLTQAPERNQGTFDVLND
jgi:hypothetical protein